MNKKIIFLVLVVSFFTIFNFSKAIVADSVGGGGGGGGMICPIGYIYDWTAPGFPATGQIQTCLKREVNVQCSYLSSAMCTRTTYLSIPVNTNLSAYGNDMLWIFDISNISSNMYYSWRLLDNGTVARETFSTQTGFVTQLVQSSNNIAFVANAGTNNTIDVVVESSTPVCGNGVCEPNENYCISDCNWFLANTTNSYTFTNGGTTYSVNLVACGYIMDKPTATLTFIYGQPSVSETLQFPNGANKSLSNGAVFKLNSVSCSSNTANVSIISGAFLSPTARGFGQVQVLNPWTLRASNGALTLNLENRVGGQITITQWTVDVGNGPVVCDVNPDVIINSGGQQILSCTPVSGWIAQTAGQTYAATLTIYYTYSNYTFTSTGTITSTYADSNTNTTCTDSDDGLNFYAKGYATGYAANGAYERVDDRCLLRNEAGGGSYVNSCSGTSCTLEEAECYNGYVATYSPGGIGVSCPNGCSDGACLNATTNATCTDSDGGLNYYTKGYVQTKDSTSTGTYYDICSGSTLTEWYCGPNGGAQRTSFYCPNGCDNGACITRPVNNVTGKCVNHDECSQACDNLGISSHWMGSGSYRRTWEGSCPSSAYGCMTGDCCLGQCPSSGDCYCLRTNAVDIYGNVCPTGSTCGQDCSCHPTGGGYVFSVKTDKYSYSPGDEMKIKATLSGNSSMDFSGATVTTTVAGTSIVMNSIGTGTSSCTPSATGTTCSISTTYYFSGTYEIPSDMASGVYKVLSTAVVSGERENAAASFYVGSNYKDYVDVSISPHEQSTIVGNEVDYYVTVIDKHPSLVCPMIVGSNCTSQSYDYIIEVEGLPYHTVFPSDVNVYAGGLKTFELKVFPSSVKTSEGITTTTQATNETSSERSVGITGKVVATQTAASETAPVQEAVFKFAVKAYLKEDTTVSHSDVGILHVKFIQTPHPPPFPETEKMNVDLRKGWNLISLPGKGSGFTQGSCSSDKKPVAFVYISGKQTFASMEEATSIMGNEELLNHLSTHSFWVYSYEDCSIGFNVDGYSTYSGLSVDSGWNLLGITKDMVGEILSNIKGDCVFEKIYNWDSISQNWMQMSENDLIDKMGFGIAVKASAACSFKANFVQPPTFPGG